MFLSSQFMSSTYTDKINPFSRCTRTGIPNWKLSPNRFPIGFSQIAFPITVLPKDDHTDFAQKERLGLPYWTMIWAICVVVDESKCLDIPIWEFSIIWEHPPFPWFMHVPLTRIVFAENFTGMFLLSFVKHAASETMCLRSLIAKIGTCTGDSDVGY